MPALGYRKWNGVYTTILKLHMKGWTNDAIGKQVGMDDSSISKIVNSERFKIKAAEFNEKYTEKARRLFESKAVEAAERIIQIAKQGKPEERLQFDAAKEILYQVGVKPVEVIETRKREYTPDEIESALKVTREVEEILTRMEKGRSRFLLDAAEGTNRLSAPVPTSEASENGEPKPEIVSTGEEKIE